MIDLEYYDRFQTLLIMCISCVSTLCLQGQEKAKLRIEELEKAQLKNLPVDTAKEIKKLQGKLVSNLNAYSCPDLPLTHLVIKCLGVPCKIVVWIHITFDNNLVIQNLFAKYMKGSWW